MEMDRVDSPYRLPVYVSENEMKQQTKEWFKLKRGVISGTSASRIFTFKRNGGAILTSLDVRNRFMSDLIEESLYEDEDEDEYGMGWSSKDMDRGNAYEDEAVYLVAEMLEAEYLFKGIDCKPEIERYAFVFGDDSKKWGMSPDAILLAIKKILVEAKCPRPAKHRINIANDVTPFKYKVQCNWNALVSQCDEYCFTSYSKGRQPFLIYKEPDKGFISLVSEYLPKFIELLEENIGREKDGLPMILLKN